MGLAESAAILLGIGIISSRFGAGVGLTELGTGIQTLVAAPLMGTGTGLLSFATGLRAVFETFGDLGRGLSTLFGSIPEMPSPFVPGNGLPPGEVPPGLPPAIPPPWGGGGGGVRDLTISSGGDDSSRLPGGGGNVPVSRTSLSMPAPIRPAYFDRSTSMTNDPQQAVMM